MKIIYRQHAVKRMHERGISEEDVGSAIANGLVIESYPNDTPFSSALLLGQAGLKAIHVVYADVVDDDLRVIITVYEPDAKIWCDDLKTRRSK
ncbi:MAG: DUF4258 domain-containing protein [Gallionellaceae bacterium]|nr:DUF4258 domain-containing protein [Gallionellaceae bacterium]